MGIWENLTRIVRKKAVVEQMVETDTAIIQTETVPPPPPPPPPPTRDELIGEIAREVQSYIANAEIHDLPIVGGKRVSVVENLNDLNTGLAHNIQENYPFEILKTLEAMAAANNHVSYAVENVVNLAHTEYEIYFSDSVKDKEAQKMKEHIKTVQSRWYDYSTGLNALINDLFTQLATFGCYSVENVPLSKLEGIKKVVRVSPYNIRFAYDKEKDDHIPLQVSPSLQTGKYPGFIELNRRTYCYAALKRYKTTPYPIPPFVSALEELAIEKDMKGSFRTMMRKMGMLGFLSVLLTAPKKLDNENDDTYRERTLRYIEQHRPSAEKGYANGIVLGLKDRHEFKLEGSNLNAAAGEQLINIVKKYIFSGLKQDPTMHGENFSTTEAFARVILAKMSTQAETYQDTVASYLEKLFFLELLFANFNPGYVEVRFKKPLIGDVKRDAETEQIQIGNVEKKIQMGMISQVQGAQELGYDKPALPGPVAPPAPAGSENEEPAEENDGKDPELKVAAVAEPELMRLYIDQTIAELRGEYPPYDYTVPGQCGVHSFDGDADFKDPILEAYISKYSSKVYTLFKNTIQIAHNGIKRDIRATKDDITPERLTEIVFYNIYKIWNDKFVEPIKTHVDRNITGAYQFYRKDKKIFSGSRAKRGLSFDLQIPDAIYSLIDYRAIEYLKNLDNLYLGRFITDDDTRRKIKDWIEASFQDNPTIGKNGEALRRFNEEFAKTLVNMDSYKIRRVVETTLNKVRNYANINYINQAEVEEFEIVEVMDRLTCDYCRHMDGKTFSVPTAVEKIERVINGKPSEVPKLSPFATTIPIEEFKKMDAKTLQMAGIDTPSYHCHCRGRVVAVI